MGIAKSIGGFAIYKEYVANKNLFIKRLSDRLNADFTVTCYDKNSNHLPDADRQTLFSKPNMYNLTIWDYEYNSKGETITLPTYELILPIGYEYNDSIQLTFDPNGVVEIMFLTFEHLWITFIETLKFIATYQDRNEAVNRYNTLRAEYINILNNLNMNSVFIVTYARYIITDTLGCMEYYPSITFCDIPRIAKEKDNLTTFELESILYAKSIKELGADFVSKPDLEIAFIDNLRLL